MTVLPGDGKLDARLLRPGVSFYTWVLERAGRVEPVGSVTDSLTVTVSEGRSVLARTQVARRGGAMLVDSSVSLTGSLAPLSHRSHQPHRRLTLTFHGRRVSGSVNSSGGEVVAFDSTQAVPVFDSSNWDLLVRALPLREGLRARFPVYDHDNGGLVWYTAHAVGVERLNEGGEAWRVESQLGSMRSTLWVDRRTRELVMVEAEVQPGVVIRQLRVDPRGPSGH